MSGLDGLRKEAEEKITNAKRKEALGRIADMLERKGIDPAEIGRVKRISLYQSLTKGEDGQAEVHDLAAIQFSPSWEDGPQWPVIAQGPAVRIPAPKATKRKDREWKRAVILPDIQAGYFRLHDETLEAIHDERAIETALAVLKDSDPDLIVLHGDNLDLAEMGKYMVTPAYARTTQAAIDYMTLLCARLRHLAPDARIVWIAGNHEERLPKYIINNAVASFGLRRGGAPESWPVLSVPHLCRLDESGVEYLPGYPTGSFWINNRIRVIHGDKVASGGSTAHKYLATEKTSVLYGHIHRREWAERTRDDHDGPKTILAASAGCLARVDGAVPSTKGGTDLDGRPLQRTEDWQQGMAVVDYQDGEGDFHLELIPIRDGNARWHGKDYAAG
jgi:hypothetical protein